MKKEELMKQYEELKGKGKEPEMIFLYIHMPTGETETIVNPNVEEKMKYIDRTYNEDLVHANCKDIYIEEACIYADFGPSMMFSDAYMLMKQGVKVKLPNWGGYWYWDAEKKTIMMHTKDGEELDIRQTDRPEYTFDNIASDEWQIADEENCPELGGEATFGFGDAYKFLERGVKVARKGWNGKGIYLEMQFPDEHSKMTQQYVYIVTTGLVTDNENAPKGLVPWTPSQTDMAAKDWVVFVEE
jgi:hypothetical protein